MTFYLHWLDQLRAASRVPFATATRLAHGRRSNNPLVPVCFVPQAPLSEPARRLEQNVESLGPIHDRWVS